LKTEFRFCSSLLSFIRTGDFAAEEKLRNPYGKNEIQHSVSNGYVQKHGNPAKNVTDKNQKHRGFGTHDIDTDDAIKHRGPAYHSD
jgi:hypothetical protein